MSKSREVSKKTLCSSTVISRELSITKTKTNPEPKFESKKLQTITYTKINSSLYIPVLCELLKSPTTYPRADQVMSVRTSSHSTVKIHRVFLKIKLAIFLFRKVLVQSQLVMAPSRTQLIHPSHPSTGSIFSKSFPASRFHQRK